LAYADCSITLLANSDPRLCDCNQIIDADAIPVAADRPDKQKELSLKADWKYIGTCSYLLPPASIINQQKITAHNNSFIPEQDLREIFHPPRA
jgi:hypothetical protein